MKKTTESNVQTLIWNGDSLKLIDQRKLPFKEAYVSCRSAEDVASAIKDMVVRGAPAIGVTAAYGVALAALQCEDITVLPEFIQFVESRIDMLAGTRPTAVNLFWALDRMKEVIRCHSRKATQDANDESEIKSIIDLILKEAKDIESQDLEINRRLGDNIFKIFNKKDKKLKILTHCNAGALATSGFGTALGIVRSLHESGMVDNVIVDETRPFLQGARLTAWELYREKIPFFIISDNMAGYFMSKGDIDIVITGADRIAANGDTANKIGTLPISILAKYYGIPFYIAAPVSTIDLKTLSGEFIPIEQRPEEEVREILGKTIVPEYMPVSNPAFDVTPAENISAIITENGVVFPPFKGNIKKIFKK